MEKIYLFSTVEDRNDNFIIFAKNRKDAEKKLCDYLIQDKNVQEFLEKWDVSIDCYADEIYFLVNAKIIK